MNPLSDLLARHRFAILDGGLATVLEQRGCDLDHPLWSARILADDPDPIADVHRDYARAGADIITTATYQASVPGLTRAHHSAAAARGILAGAGALARAAVGGPPPLVAGSIGSYGATLADGSEYRGDYALSDAQLAGFHRERLGLVATGVDLLACETIPSLAEGRVLAGLIEQLGGPPGWISFSVADDAHSSHGEPIEDCVRALEGFGRLVAVGVNCFDPAWGEALVRRIAAVTSRPIVIYPNSGQRWQSGDWTGEATPLQEFTAYAARWVDAGARIVGGCCRTDPSWIAALRRLRDTLG
jgi:homocysteine S-methyltransferase